MMVELKNGETYNGILINCDIWYVGIFPPAFGLRTLNLTSFYEPRTSLRLFHWTH